MTAGMGSATVGLKAMMLKTNKGLVKGEDSMVVLCSPSCIQTSPCRHVWHGKNTDLSASMSGASPRTGISAQDLTYVDIHISGISQPSRHHCVRHFPDQCVIDVASKIVPAAVRQDACCTSRQSVSGHVACIAQHAMHRAYVSPVPAHCWGEPDAVVEGLCCRQSGHGNHGQQCGDSCHPAHEHPQQI